jgi:hypothetical protein
MPFSLKKALSRIPDDIKGEFLALQEQFMRKYADRPDLARVRSFRKAVGLDALLKVQAPKGEEQWEDYTIQDDAWLDEDEFFKYRRIIATASGVNKNKLYKPVDAIEALADLQQDWTIPMTNDHPDDLHPEDDVISGFMVIVGSQALDKGEVGIVALEAVPKGDKDALSARSFSIGYYAKEDRKSGVYKGKAYEAVQSDLFIIHNARMVTQQASNPRATVIDQGKGKPSKVAEGTDMADEIAELKKALADKDVEIHKAGIAHDATKDTLVRVSAELKTAKDRITQLETEIVPLKDAKTELDKLRKAKADKLREKVKASFPGPKGQDCIFPKEELDKMTEPEMERILKVAGVKDKLDFETVPEGTPEEDEDDGYITPGLPSTWGKKDKAKKPAPENDDEEE